MKQQAEVLLKITTGYDYFKLENLPKLAEEKNNEEQIKMCFECYKSEYWETLFD